LALQTKLVPIILLPLAALVIWVRCRNEQRSLKHLILSLVVMAAGLVISYVAVDCLIEKGAYLLHFGQTWTSHFGIAKSYEYGSAEEHGFDWSALAKNWDLSAAAILGAALLARRARANLEAAIPLTWLGLAFLVFGLHKPWWPYYYVHTALPMCWCAAVGLVQVAVWAWSKRKFAALVAMGLFGACALAWMGARVYLQVRGVKQSEQLYASLVLQEAKRFKPMTQWLYASREIYSFYADIPMPPDLAVLPLKRFWSGEMTNERLAAELEKYQPGLILLANDGRSVPFQRLLEADYHLVYFDPGHRLYAHSSISRKASR